MRKTLLVSVAAGVSLLGAASYVEANPLERMGRVLRERPQPAPGERLPARPGPQGSASAPAKPSGAASIPDQGVHNAVHAAHQGQIVFTRSDLGIGAISEAAIVSDFTLGQPMFFRVFTRQSAVNAIAAANGMAAGQVYADGVHYLARFTIDGQTFDTDMFPWGGRRDHETWTTWRGQFVNSINAQRTPGSDSFLEMLSRATAAGLLKPGKHSVKMEVIPQTNTERNGKIKAGPVASGTFSLTVPAGVFQSGNPHICGAARGAAGSAALEARAFAHARQFWDWPDLTLVKAVATGNEWKVERHEITGIPIERSTQVRLVARGAKYCTSHTHEFTEKYMGGGNFSTATGGISVNFTPGYVPCGCLG